MEEDVRISCDVIVVRTVHFSPNAAADVPIEVSGQNQVHMILVNVEVEQLRHSETSRRLVIRASKVLQDEPDRGEIPDDKNSRARNGSGRPASKFETPDKWSGGFPVSSIISSASAHADRVLTLNVVYLAAASS
jgi:hypothetical protein